MHICGDLIVFLVGYLIGYVLVLLILEFSDKAWNWITR